MQMNRRHFLAASTAFAAPFLFGGNVRKFAANEKINIGEKGEWLYCMRGNAKVTPSDPDVPQNGKMQPLMASKNKLLTPIANPTHRSIRVHGLRRVRGYCFLNDGAVFS